MARVWFQCCEGACVVLNGPKYFLRIDYPTSHNALCSNTYTHLLCEGLIHTWYLTSKCPRCSHLHVKQVNLGVGVRFGLSLKQGNRRTMEDTATHLADACGDARGIRRNTFQTERQPGELSTMPSSAAAAAAAAVPVAAAAAPMVLSGDPTKPLPHAAAYFGVYDGMEPGRNVSI